MIGQPELYFMKSNLLFWSSVLVLGACSREPDSTPVVPPLIAASSASAPTMLEASSVSAVSKSSGIAAQILNSPQEQDILATSRQAMQSITASDVAEFRAVASQVANSESEMVASSLPQSCIQYYQRVEQCFANQPDGEGLLSLNDELKNELVEQDSADEQLCQGLNHSFDAVAQNLGCQ